MDLRWYERCGRQTREANLRHDGVVYAGLGDSMSIDDYAGGPGRGAASLLWRNRDHDFPAWAGRELTAGDPTARLALLASDGATSTTVAHQQLDRLGRLELTRTLATVTTGGNELLAAYSDHGAARRAIGMVIDNGRLVLAVALLRWVSPRHAEGPTSTWIRSPQRARRTRRPAVGAPAPQRPARNVRAEGSGRTPDPR